jgi:hypothetical protein
VQLSELATELCLRGRQPATLADPLEDQVGREILVAVAGRKDLWYRYDAGLT